MTALVLGVLAMVGIEIVMITSLVMTQQAKERSDGWARLQHLTLLFSARVSHSLYSFAYSVKRTAAIRVFRNSSFVTQREFEESNQLQYSPFAVVGLTSIWVPVIPAKQRAEYERFYGFPITELNQWDNATTSRTVSDVYVPFTLCDPFQVTPLTGLDILSATHLMGLLNSRPLYLVPMHDALDSRVLDRFGLFFGALNLEKTSYALGRIEMLGVLETALAVPRLQVVMATYGMFRDESQQLLFLDPSPLLTGLRTVAAFTRSANKALFHCEVIDVFSEQLLLCLHYDAALTRSYVSSSWEVTATVLSCVCFVVDIVIIKLLLLWMYRRDKYKSELHKRHNTQQMMGYVSHEIRNPLNTIIGLAELRLGKLDGTVQDDHWAAVLSSGEAIERVANDVLDIRRVEQGKTEVIIEELNISALFADLSIAVMPMMQKLESVAVVKVVDAFFCSVWTDKYRLRQILLNFLTNALKHTKEGTITLSFAVLDLGVGRFAVKDTGTGIPLENQHVLFKQFQQTSRADIGSGFGLGLYLTKRLALLLDGKIGFASEFGVGSCFWVDLPIRI